MTAPTLAYSHDTILLLSPHGVARIHGIAIVSADPPFLTGWSWDDLLDGWRKFVTDFKTHYPDKPESGMPAAWEQLQNEQ